MAKEPPGCCSSHSESSSFISATENGRFSFI